MGSNIKKENNWLCCGYLELYIYILGQVESVCHNKKIGRDTLFIGLGLTVEVI